MSSHFAGMIWFWWVPTFRTVGVQHLNLPVLLRQVFCSFHQIVWGQIRKQKIRDLLDQSRLGLRFDLSNKGNKERLEEAFDQMETTKQGSWSSYNYWINLLGLLTELPCQVLASQSYNLKEPVDDRLARVIDYVFEKVETQIDPALFDESSNLVSMTPAAFSRFFKRHTGRTFSRFVNEAKIARACRCLVESEETILTISLECGFGSLSHLTESLWSTRDVRLAGGVPSSRLFSFRYCLNGGLGESLPQNFISFC